MRKKQFLLIISALFISSFFLMSCDSQSQKTDEIQATKASREIFVGKQQAPVEITTELKEGGTGKVNFSFLAKAEEVQIQITGLDGLTISNSPTLEKNQYEKGAKTEVPISFTSALGQSYVNVLISGNFGGRFINKTQVFSFGSPSLAQQKAKQKPVAQDSQGRNIVIVPMKSN